MPNPLAFLDEPLPPPAPVTPVSDAARLELATQQKSTFMEMVSEATLGAYGRYAEAIHGADDPEDLRKFVAQGVDILGWKTQTAKDPNDNLPMFNIIVNGGGVTVQSVNATRPTASELPTIDEDDPSDDDFNLDSMPTLSRYAPINDELGSLDA